MKHMKPMKKMKRLLGVLLAAVMVLAFGVTVSAAEGNFTITAPANDHTYEVYQIFKGDYSSGVLSNVKWGKNGTGTEDEAVNSSIIDELTGVNSSSDTDQLEVISKYVDLNSDEFGTVKNGTPLSAPAGYYLIKDVDGSQTGENDSYTLYIATVGGDITITPKADTPEMNKKVQDINDSTNTTSDWQDSADYDIGDLVKFRLSGTVAENYGDYSAYKFVFHDKEQTGLTFQKESVVVKVDGKEINSGYNVVTEGLSDGCTFEVQFDNLKTISDVHANSVITVEYESKLNENANIGATGNKNSAKLEYSNNPNDAQEGETANTPWDNVIVFTYKTVINKIDGETNPLPGAAFKLEKKNSSGTWDLVKAFTADEHTTKFEFSGLDDGTYKLTETTTPGGYNTIEPIEFTVTATHDILSDDPGLTNLSGNATSGEITFRSNTSDGSLSADVVNQKGSTLPETGGIGTTIFYVVGGILVIGAAVLLITRRRMNK